MLDENGFKRKTYEDLVDEMSNKAKELFGSDANTSDRSFLGILTRVMSWFLSLLWQDVEAVYYSSYRNTAEGVQLDRLLKYSGITRNQAEAAFGEVTFTGTPNFTIEAGEIVATQSGVQFVTLDAVQLDVNGIGTVAIQAIEEGISGNVGINTITVLVNPTADISAVTNVAATSGGRERETDAEAKARAQQTIEGIGSATTNAIRSESLRVSTIRAARVIENDTDTTDSYGTPPHAIQAFVLGGANQDIAQAIFRKKAAGIKAYGTTVVNVLDDSQNAHKIGFTRATEVRVYAKVTITPNMNYTNADADRIKDLLVQHVGGVDTSNNPLPGLSMGEDIVLARMIAKAFIDTVDDVVITLSTNGTTYTSNNIAVDINDIARLNATDIEVIELV